VRARVAIAAVIALLALAGMIALVVHAVTGNSGGPAAFPFGATATAPAPFGAFEEGRVALDGKCVRVLVARSAEQRSQGLRGVTALGPYAGMLFVFPGTTSARFTMAQTPTPLAITWYDAKGNPVDGTEMTPCPDGTDATCPTYASKHSYRYALEHFSGSGSGAAGALAGC
jgi:uncharacterized membrane protein (UPF0127 family)